MKTSAGVGLLGLSFLVAGCGYTAGTLARFKAIEVETFENVTERRHHEFGLTRQVVRELGHAGVRVGPRASQRLEGEIVDFQSPILAEDASDSPLVGSISIRVKVRVVEKSTGRILLEESFAAAASFTELRGKPAEAARQEVFRRLAGAIVSKLESGW